MTSRSNIIKKLSNRKAIYFKKSKKKKILKARLECCSNKRNNRYLSLSASADDPNTFDIQQTYNWTLHENREAASREIPENFDQNVQSQIFISDSQKDFTCSNNNMMQNQTCYMTYDCPFQSCDCCSHNAPLPVINDFEINDDLIRRAVEMSNTDLRIQQYFEPSQLCCGSVTNVPIFSSTSLTNCSCKCKRESQLSVSNFCNPVTNFIADESESNDESIGPSQSSSFFYDNQELCRFFEQFRKFSISPKHRRACKMRRKSRSTTDQVYRNNSFSDQTLPYDTDRKMFSIGKLKRHLDHRCSSPFIRTIEKICKTNKFKKPGRHHKYPEISPSSSSPVDISEGRFKKYPIQRSVYTQSPSVSDHSNIDQPQGQFFSGDNLPSQASGLQKNQQEETKFKIIEPFTQNKNSSLREVVDSSADIALLKPREERSNSQVIEESNSLSNVSSDDAIQLQLNRSSNVHNSSIGVDTTHERRHSKSSLKKAHTRTPCDRKKKRIQFVDILIGGKHPTDDSKIFKELKEEDLVDRSAKLMVRNTPDEIVLQDIEHEPAERRSFSDEEDDQDKLSTRSASSHSNLSNSSNGNNEKAYKNFQKSNSTSADPLSSNVSSNLLKYHIKCLLNSWSSFAKNKKKIKLSKPEHPINPKLVTKLIKHKCGHVCTPEKIQTNGEVKKKTNGGSRNLKSFTIVPHQPTETKSTSLSRRFIKTVFSPIESKHKNHTKVHHSSSNLFEKIPKNDPKKSHKHSPLRSGHVEDANKNRSILFDLDHLDPSSPIGRWLTNLSDHLVREKKAREFIDSIPRKSRKLSSSLRTKIFKTYHSASNQSQNNSHESVESHQTKHKMTQESPQNLSEIKKLRDKADRKLNSSSTNHKSSFTEEHRQVNPAEVKVTNCKENLKVFYNFMYRYYRNKVLQYNVVVMDEPPKTEKLKYNSENVKRTDERIYCDEFNKQQTTTDHQPTIAPGPESPKNNHSNTHLKECGSPKDDHVKAILKNNSFRKVSSAVRPNSPKHCSKFDKDADGVNKRNNSEDGLESALARSVVDRIKSLALEELKAYFQNPNSEWNRHFDEYTKESSHFLNIFKDHRHLTGKHSLERNKNTGCFLECNQNRECSLQHSKNTCAWNNAASRQKNSAEVSQDGRPVSKFHESVKPLGHFSPSHHENLSACSRFESNKLQSDQLRSMEFNNHAAPNFNQVPIKCRPSICPDRICVLDRAYEAQRKYSPRAKPVSISRPMSSINQLISINQPRVSVSNLCPPQHDAMKMHLNQLLDQRHGGEIHGLSSLACPHKQCACHSKTCHSHVFPAVAHVPQIVFPHQVSNQNASNMEDCMSWLAKDFYPIQKQYNP